MLDWGFKNIEDHLIRHKDAITGNAKALFHEEPSISVDYDWSGDAIRISISLRLSEKVQKTSATLSEIREQVVFIVTYVRGLLALKPYDAFFRHKGFRNRETPEDLEGSLSAATGLIVTVRDKESNILGMCSAPLLGEEMEWMKIGKP